MDRLLADPGADRPAWTRQNGSSAAFAGAALTHGQKLLAQTDLASTVRLTRLSDVVTMTVFSGQPPLSLRAAPSRRENSWRYRP